MTIVIIIVIVIVIVNSILNKYLYEMKYKKFNNIIIPNKIQISKIYNLN